MEDPGEPRMMSDAPSELPRALGRYTLVRRIGRGGMGIVYAARDERLGRDVALKMIAGLSNDDAIKRFWREARAAASVSHPNVCQIYEVDESDEGIFLAMELLDGESLESRLARGSLRPAEARRVVLDLLAALGALHERGFVHRDVKPSNLFLTPLGAKLLDFGLARTATTAEARAEPAPNVAPSAITQPGMIIGTPQYMAPEQVYGEAIDARADVYATGAVLFEMLAGRPAFTGKNTIDIVYAVLHELPPALQGPPAVVAIDHIIRRALAKSPADRPPSALAMRQEIDAVQVSDGATNPAASAVVLALTRLVVPPFRMLRPDDETAFLSLGLAEAVSTSLASLRDVIIRSPSMAAAATTDQPDIRRIAADADVDLVVLGSLLRMNDQIRATVQLIEARSGTVVGAQSVRGDMDDIFALEDGLVRAVGELLSPYRVAHSAPSAARDAPAQGKAFEYFLRGIEHARDLTDMDTARDWFQRALDEDPVFAPAWAWIGRCHRFIGKYEHDREENNRRAEDAIRRALALSPNLAVAHRFLTHLEAEDGRADAAIARLLEHARVNRNDAQLFAALVHACRYAGLYEASLAAHEEARRLDPTVPTSWEYTLLMAGDFERLRKLRNVPGADPGAVGYATVFGDADADNVRYLRDIDLARLPRTFQLTLQAVRAVVLEPLDTESRRAEAARVLDAAAAGHGDPEAIFLFAAIGAYLGDHERTIAQLERVVRGGYSPVTTLEQATPFQFLRGEPRFQSLVDAARMRRQVASTIFERHGGPALLGISAGVG